MRALSGDRAALRPALRALRPFIIWPFLAALIAIGVSFAVTPTFTATTRILPPQQGGGAAALFASQLGSLAGIAGAAAGIKNPADQYVTFLRSTTISDRLIDRFKLRDQYAEEFIEDVRKQLERNSAINAGAKDGIITIEVDDPSPARAAEMANAYVEELQELTNALAITEAAQRRVYFESQLKQVTSRLAKAEEALRESGVSASLMNVEPRSAVEVVARLRAAVMAAEVKVSLLSNMMTDRNPEYRLALKELSELKEQLAKVEAGSRPTAAAPRGGEAYIAKYRDFKYQEALFEMMAKQLELAKLDESRQGTLIQVIDTAQAGEKKSWPKRGAIAALTWLTTLLLVVFLELLRARHRQPPMQTLG
ncbi:MAG: Wzz/FepE/Etk N-terminal domain-containing protein [Burkholderiales bacterium]|nr:Wzz/FepE/Etk N-terminal domain-containing protein [Burkholderiales bacterium]